MTAAKVNWLEQVGLDVAKGLKAAMGGATTVVNLPSTVSTDISDIKKMVNAVTTVEAIDQTLKDKNLTGPEKLAAAAPQVQQVILDTEFLAGKKIANPTLFATAIAEYTQATVDLAQSLEAQPASASGAPLATPSVAAAPTPAAPVPVSSAIPED